VAEGRKGEMVEVILIGPGMGCWGKGKRGEVSREVISGYSDAEQREVAHALARVRGWCWVELVAADGSFSGEGGWIRCMKGSAGPWRGSRRQGQASRDRRSGAAEHEGQGSRRASSKGKRAWKAGQGSQTGQGATSVRPGKGHERTGGRRDGKDRRGRGKSREGSFLRVIREQAAWEAVHETLVEEGGNVTAVARRLGVDRTTVYRRCRAAGVEIHRYRRGEAKGRE
jgi:hypothetical protein